MRDPRDIAEEIRVISAKQEAQKQRAGHRSRRLEQLSLEAAVAKLDDTLIVVDHDKPLKEMCAENGFGLWETVGHFGESVNLSDIKFPTQDAGLVRKRCRLIPVELFPGHVRTLEQAARKISSFGLVPAGIRDLVVYYTVALPSCVLRGPILAYGSLGIDPNKTRWGARIWYDEEGYLSPVRLELLEVKELEFWMHHSWSATFLVTTRDVSG